MPFHMGPLEIGIVLLIVMMIFGVGKLPSVMRKMGEGFRELRKGINEEQSEL